MSIHSLWTEFTTWYKGTVLGQEIDAAGAAAKKEIGEILPAALLSIVESTSAAILPGILAQSSTASIISAGIAAAETAFEAQDAKVASTTISTFVSTLHTTITAQQAAGAITPVAA